MNEARRRARAALAALPTWDGGDTSSLELLQHGRSSDCWRVGQGYVLRVDHAGASRFGHERAAELEVIMSAASAGLAPRVVDAAPELGVLLTEFIEGHTWTRDRLLDPAQLVRLAESLRRLHQLQPRVRPFDLRGAVARYAAALGDAAAATRARAVYALLDTVAPYAAVLCHNDVVCSNIIDDGRLWLIDWEFGGLGHPLFDLAVVVEHHRLNRSLMKSFIDAYAGGAGRPEASQLETWRRIYTHLLALWQPYERHLAATGR